MIKRYQKFKMCQKKKDSLSVTSTAIILTMTTKHYLKDLLSLNSFIQRSNNQRELRVIHKL